MAKVIIVKNLHKIYRAGESTVHALTGVSLSVAQGEFIAITGVSGSGKSTLLNLLAGLEPATFGEIVIAGAHIEKMNESELVRFRSKNVGFIFQSFNLISSMTAVENVALPLRFKGIRKSSSIETASGILCAMRLERHLNHFPHQLSGGQQQRVGIARALVAEPSVIFADEPTGSLDSQNGKEIIEYIKWLTTQKRQTVLMVTHDMDLAYNADRIIRLHDGRISV